MKLTSHIFFLALLSILLPLLARSQNSSPSRDPIFREARKAQQEGRIADAEKILDDGIHAVELTEPNSPRLVPYLNLLVGIYMKTQRRKDVHAIYERVLEIDRTAFGPGDGRSLRDLINLASTMEPEKNEEAEHLLRQALDLAVQNPKAGQIWELEALAHLAQLYQSEKRYYDAEPLAERGIKICAATPPYPGPCESVQRTLEDVYRNEGRRVDAGQVAATNMDAEIPPELQSLNDLAQRDADNGLYVQAEFTYRQALAWVEAHPLLTDGQITTDLTSMLPMEYNGIGRALEKQGRDVLAEESYKKSIELQETKALENPVSVRFFDFSHLTNFYGGKGRLSEMEPIFQHALIVQEKALGESSTYVARTLLDFGGLLKGEGKYAEAEPLFERALKIDEVNLGSDNPQTFNALSSYADLLLKLHEDAKPPKFKRASAR